MPVLQYRCDKCNKDFEELVKSHDCPVRCPDCGALAKRSWSGEILSATGKQSKKCSGNCKTCGGCR
ncbi:MAG: zinc ribbon domain-containing protein [Clostridia bacterium]|nr:zinc ribbon domain-containing protein [Clostridia bacterium]